jgi:hypothetical protein
MGDCDLTKMKMAPFFTKETERNSSPLITEFKLMGFVEKEMGYISNGTCFCRKLSYKKRCA